MAQYIFAYHGGSAPSDPAEVEKVMAAWNDWYGSMGDKVAHGGGPCGPSKTVSSGGTSDGGGANPLSGFTIVSADSMEEACKMAAGCPINNEGGNVEVCEVIEM